MNYNYRINVLLYIFLSFICGTYIYVLFNESKWLATIIASCFFILLVLFNGIKFSLLVMIFFSLNLWSITYAAPMDEIKGYIEDFQKKSGVKNVNVVVYDNGNVNYYGNTDTKSLFQIGSMSKSFTGLGILKLVNEGKIGLNDDISDLLNDFKYL